MERSTKANRRPPSPESVGGGCGGGGEVMAFEEVTIGDCQTKVEPTYICRLYLSGPIEIAKQIIRAECLREGLCVTVEPTTFMYTGGEEAGYVVGLLNYPKFPAQAKDVRARGMDLMGKLLDGTCQHSALFVDADETTWITRRIES